MSQPEAERHALVADPAVVEECLARAKSLESERRYEEAAEIVEPLFEATDHRPDVSYRLGCIRARQGRLEESEELLRLALAQRYEDARVHTNLGVVLDLQGRCDEAIRAFRRAIQLAPSDPVARLNLGALYGELGRHEDAARELGRCRRLAPGFDASFNLALVRYRQGEHAAAAGLFAEALDYDRTHALGHYYLGRCHFKLGRTEDAVSSLLTALRHQPDLVHARFGLGMAWNKMSRYRMAVQELEQVARVLADDGRVHYQLGIAYDGLAMKTEARESFRRARTLAG